MIANSNLKNSRKIAKNSIIMYVRMLVTIGISLYISRLVLLLLGVSDFGLYNLIGGVVTLLGFLNSAMASATQRYLSFYIGVGDKIKLRNVFRAVYTIHLIIALILLVVAEIVGPWFVVNHLNISEVRIETALVVFHLSVVTLIFTVVRVPFNAALLAKEDIRVYAGLSVIEVLLKLCFVWVMQFIDFDKLILYSSVLLFTSIIVFCFNFLFVRRKYFFCSVKISQERAVLVELSQYTSWNLLGTSSSIGSIQGINILLNIFYGTIVNASRGIAFQVQSMARLFVSNFQLAVNPQIVKSYAAKDSKYLFSLIYLSSKLSFILLLFIGIPLVVETEYILDLWLVKVPKYSIVFTRLIVINVLIDSISGPLMTAIHATGDVKKYQILISIILILNLPVSYVLFVLKMEPQSAFCVNICLTMVALFVRLFLLKKQIKLDVLLFLNKVLKPILVVTISSIIIPTCALLFCDYGVKRFFIVIVTSFLSLIIFVYLYGLDRKEKEFVIEKIIYIKQKLCCRVLSVWSREL